MGPKVIIVDDDRDTRESLQAILETEGFDVKLAANGLRLISSLHVDRPDVILLDVVMSWIDGFELCQALKKNPRFRDIPVIFISGRTTEADRTRGLSMGALDYLPKPIDVPKLLSQLRKLSLSPPPASAEAPPQVRP